MITGFRHKSLQRLFEKGDARYLPPEYVKKLKRVLFALHHVESKAELTGAFFNCHSLKGKYEGYYALSVSGNWRLVFCYEEPLNQISQVDLVDYH